MCKIKSRDDNRREILTMDLAEARQYFPGFSGAAVMDTTQLVCATGIPDVL